MKFSINDFFSKCDQIRRKLQIWSHLLKKLSMEILIFCAVYYFCISLQQPWLNNYSNIELTIKKPCKEANSPKSDFSKLSNAL